MYIYLIEHNRHFLSTYFLLILSNFCIDLMIFKINSIKFGLYVPNMLCLEKL